MCLTSVSFMHFPRSWTDERASWIVVILLLVINTLEDIRKKSIHLMATAAASVYGLVRSAAIGRHPFELTAALLPGLLLIAFSFLTKGGIGTGDGIVITALGFFLQPFTIIGVCALAFFIASVPAGILLLRHRKRSMSFPFMPFLFAACGILLLM